MIIPVTLSSQFNGTYQDRSIEVTERRGRRRKQLLDGLKGRIGYWKLEEALDRTLWRTR